MQNAVIVCGPAGCGKTLHAKALAEFFGCSEIFDSWRPVCGLRPDTLHLTQHVPGGPPLPYDKDGLRAFMFDDAMRQMTTHHASTLHATARP